MAKEKKRMKKYGKYSDADTADCYGGALSVSFCMDDLYLFKNRDRNCGL